MSDFFNTAASAVTSIVSTTISEASIIKTPTNDGYSAAEKTFGTGGDEGYTTYNLPKMKFSFVVEFILSEQAKAFISSQLASTHTLFKIWNCSYFVRDVKLPSYAFQVEELNQYNKNRYQTGKVIYKPSVITFYDTIDSSALLLFDAYKKYYYGDFFNKDSNSFRNDTYSNPVQFENISTNWGRSALNTGQFDNQYFFKQINVYEIDNDTYTVHNMYNAFIESIDTDTKSHESSGEASTISCTLRYEGTNNITSTGSSIAQPSAELNQLLTNTTMMGKTGFYKYFGEMDDKSNGALTIGKIINAGTSTYDIIGDVKDILNGDITADTIRNIGSAVTKGASAVGLGSVVSEASKSLGLGNILGDF